jgi:hypothetical protein
MKKTSQEQESIIGLLTRIYMEILEIEDEFQLMAGGNDFRPRIEHFHDAVRAFSSDGDYAPERLSVERLAYDLNCLRYIVSMPLASFKTDGGPMSPSADLVVLDKGLSVRSRRPGRAVRERITELYQTYSVLFAALLKPSADNDYHDRIDNLNQDVEDLHKLGSQLDALMDDKSRLPRVITAIQHLEEDGLREELMKFMQQNKHAKRDNLKKLVQFLKEHAAGKDKQIEAIEQAHMTYVMSQLGIFENSKDMLKKMAAQGMNLVGRFVENAVAQSRREMGRS